MSFSFRCHLNRPWVKMSFHRPQLKSGNTVGERKGQACPQHHRTNKSQEGFSSSVGSVNRPEGFALKGLWGLHAVAHRADVTKVTYTLDTESFIWSLNVKKEGMKIFGVGNNNLELEQSPAAVFKSNGGLPEAKPSISTRARGLHESCLNGNICCTDSLYILGGKKGGNQYQAVN